MDKKYYLHFNSIKVQLKPGAEKVDATLDKFQFHKGTIKTAEGKD